MTTNKRLLLIDRHAGRSVHALRNGLIPSKRRPLANFGSNTVTIYPAGNKNLLRAISDDINGPEALGV